jgi:hypothetical protein
MKKADSKEYVDLQTPKVREDLTKNGYRKDATDIMGLREDPSPDLCAACSEGRPCPRHNPEESK